jgi:hypothetical protein
MTTFAFTSPEGQEYEIEGPEGATQEQAFAVLQQHLGGGDDASETDPEAPAARMNRAISDRMPDFVNQIADALGQPASGVLEGLAGMLNLPGSLVRAAGEKLGVDPSNLPMSAEEVKRAGVESGLTAEESDSAGGRISRRVGEEVGAALVPAGAVLKTAEMGRKGASLFKPAVEAAKAAPAAFAKAETGLAALGGLGAGTAKEIAPESKAAEITGLLIGTLAPAAAAGSVRRLVRGGDGTRRAMEKSVKEFAEAGATPTVGMATGRRFNESIEAGLAILPGSSGRMATYAEKTARQMYNYVDNAAAGIAPIRSTDTAGTAIKGGIKDYVRNFKNTWRALDAKVAKIVAPGISVRANNTRGAMVELADPVNAAAYPQLAKIAERLDDVSRGGVMAYKDLRTFRSSVGGLIPESYAANLPQGQLKKLYAAMTDDLRAHLRATDPKALAAFERSNKYYQAAMSRLDQRLAPLTTSDIPERVFVALERSGHAGPTVMNAAKRSIGKDNWDVVAATIFDRMGRASPGAQDAAGDVFSLNTFLTNWSKYGRNKGTLQALTQGTSGGAKFTHDMGVVAKVAERFREAGRVFANPSGTARAIANIGLGTSVAGSALAGQGGITLRILGIASGANMSARAFTNPKFVNFLARSTEIPAARMPGLIARLGSSMASEPEDVQVEIATFLDQLSDEFSVQGEAER